MHNTAARSLYGKVGVRGPARLARGKELFLSKGC